MAENLAEIRAEVAAPKRVEAVIAKVTVLAREKGADEALIKKMYRNMIADFVVLEKQMLVMRV
ncbi:hypothetical protein Hs30E_07480 [Lactococcus hodotermopsidis]|uniref:Chorismate mutase domain-containing protein n=1 Tax=Pseudolactococcus hodotermopsidis TaxID=2709157 RepID=A0A6A0BEE0_9LACT|nr:hypothetical protein [Lactococcus hodotermopsidis]GFH42197.1 hypothetical protein Hs30E_07480 [Lactococcus hodotermopsidis]